jgi:phage recombination protein Bet
MTTLVKYQDSISGSEVELSIAEIKNNICPKATDKEAANFLRLCQYMGLNPFVNDAYLIKYGDSPASMVVGKDAFTKRADAHPQFAGIESGVVIQRGDAEPINRKGTLVLTGENIVGGWAKVARTDRKLDVETTVSFGEFSTGRAMWAKMPATMIEKVAIVKSLRTAFPATFSGMYDQAEMGIDMSQDLEPVNTGKPNLMEEIAADEIANPKPEPQVKIIDPHKATHANQPDPECYDCQEDAKNNAVETAENATKIHDGPGLVEIAKGLGAVVVEENNFTATLEEEEEASIVEGHAPHCLEHDTEYEWRVNPDTNEGRYVHQYQYDAGGSTRQGWCVFE